ncbi:hypothetical protein Tco_0670818 [Tanacetum coccineum]
MVICEICKPWGIIITNSNRSKSFDEMFPRDFLVLEHHYGEGFSKSEEMIAARFSFSFFVSDFNIELLEQKDPPHQSCLSILFSKDILYSRMVVNRFGNAMFLLVAQDCPIAKKSLASHMEFEVQVPSGAIKIRAAFNFLLVEVIKEESKEEVQEEVKDEESTRKRKIGTRKKMKSRKRRYIQNTSEDDSDKENDELRLYLTIAQDEEKEVDYEILDRKYPIKEWKTECLGAKPQSDQAEHLEEINLNVVIRSNGQKRYFSTLMTVLSIFDREDLNAVYQLVMEKYQDEMPEGFDRVLWGDLMVLFNPDDKDVFWSSQIDWIIVSWKLHSSSGVHTLVTDTGLIIHMLVEKKYPLRKEVLKQMLKLKLESEEENTMALKLIKFVKKILAELESEE